MVSARRSASILVMVVTLITAPSAGSAATHKKLRLGYLDRPGSALVILAAAGGHFRSQGVRAHLVKFRDSKSGLAALEAGRIDAGAFAVGETLQRIADGATVSILSGGGTEQPDDPIADLDEAQMDKGIVVAVADRSGAADRAVQVKLVTALIRAYRELQTQPDAAWDQIEKKISPSGKGRWTHFDPNPDYWRLERVWHRRGLQGEGMPRDFLAGRINEEIYCDALADLVEETSRNDPVLQHLQGRAVCVTDCCPTKAEKTHTNTGGSL